jgi:hypothetical protein
MACLLYGIVFAASAQSLGEHTVALLPGVGDAPVRLLGANGLSAAVSMIDPRDATPSVANARAYARVVEALHAAGAVVPMRFGCWFAGEAEVVDLLHTSGSEFTRMLHRLDGCVEMGVRLLTVCPGVAAAGTSRSAESPRDASVRAPGSVYLTRRKALYAEADRLREDVTAAAERVRRALAGRFVQFRIEPPSGAWRPGTLALPWHRALGSVYFLVKWDALEPFRAAFRELSSTEPGALVLSGPWPPYNFVVPEELYGRLSK